MGTSTAQKRITINAYGKEKIRFLDEGLDIYTLKHGDILKINNKEELIDRTPIKSLDLLQTWSRGLSRPHDGMEEKTVIWKLYQIIKDMKGYLLNQLNEGILGQFGDVSEKLSYRDGERYLDKARL